MLCAVFLGAALVVYQPAFDGPFVSDDIHYVSNNDYVHELSVANLLEILHPTGSATIAIVNYSPVQILLHALAWRAFGSETTGHHVVNVFFHVTASVLLVALFLATGIPRAAAVLGGACFLLHPANVEAVAWISQLKSSSALVLSLAALLAFPRRPALGTVFFALALLAKPNAAYALPVAILFAWTRGGAIRWRWFAISGALFAGFAVAEFAVHQRAGAAEGALYETPLALVLTVMSLAARYIAMAATSFGVSTFHEPAPVHSPLDPWWIASLVALTLLGLRTVSVLRRRRPESVYWAWALISFGPVSQIFPFLYPLADRYLYFILPGLLGGALLAGVDGIAWLARFLEARAGVAPERTRARAQQFAVALGVACCVLFAVRSVERAEVWKSPSRVVADAARNYPNGVSASLLRARRAAQFGDVDGAVAAVRAAKARGYNRFEQLLGDPALAPVRADPRFQAVVREMAGDWIASLGRKSNLTQHDLRLLAAAHFARGEYRDAIAVVERALALDGPLHDSLQRDLRDLRALQP
jgi:hypothetical protein